MGVHDELSRLIRDSGHGVLDDGEHFRAVLDDYLDEADATRGEINLLVDAVRLGAFRRLQDQIAHGADVRRAIALAGDELARDRGTTESTSAAWALGVLAFATGSLDEEGLSELRAAREPDPDTPPRPAPPRSLPAPAPATVKRPATIPDPAAPVGETPASGRRAVVTAVVAVVAVVGAVAGVAWWSAGDDEPTADRPVRTASSGPFEPLTVAGGTEVMKRVRAERTYRLTEERISSAVVLTNTARRALTVLWTEVVPKELAEHVSQVTFEPETRNVLEADPIVFWRLTLPAGGQRTVRWTTALAPDVTPSADHLARATGWHREAVTRAEPQITADLPAYVRPGDVLLAPVVPEPVEVEDVPTGSTRGTSDSTASGPGTVIDPSTTPRPTRAANRAPRLSLRPTSSNEQDGVGYAVSASDPDGDSWSIVSVSGAPAGVGRSGAHTLGGTVSWRAASVTTHRSSIRSRSFAVTVTVQDSRGARASQGFTWTVRDTHLAMPAYVGKYGNSPDIGSLFVPNFVGCLDTSRPVDTIARQSVPAGTPVRWGSSPRFTYVHHTGSYPAC